MNAQLKELAAEFDAFRKKAPIGAITTVREYNRAVEVLDSILDMIGERETGAIARLADAISTQIAAYDDEHYNLPDVSPVEVLRFLMEQHDLNQGDLPEVGNQSVVSQVLSGKRELNTRQIAALCRRFGVSAESFLTI